MKTIEIKTLIELIEKQRDVYDAVMVALGDPGGDTQKWFKYKELIGRMQGTLDVISMLNELMGEDA